MDFVSPVTFSISTTSEFAVDITASTTGLSLDLSQFTIFAGILLFLISFSFVANYFRR